MQEKIEDIKMVMVDEVKRRIIFESIPKIISCIDLLREEELSTSTNEHTNSIGNLIHHLNGNVRQWILSGACGKEDNRDRDFEFDNNRVFRKSELIDLLKNLSSELEEVLPSLLDKNFLSIKKVQCYEEHTIAILIHAIEHFSYHTGQIVYITKMLRNKDLAFYAGDSLNNTN